MEKLFYIFISLLLLSGCLEFKNARRWCYDCPAGDSIMNLFTIAFANEASDDSLNGIAKGLIKLRDEASENKELDALFHYTKARIMFRRGNDSAWNEIQMALSLSDSSKYPYAHIRFRNVASLVNYCRTSDVKAYYSDLKAYEDYYSNVGDSVSLAQTLTNMGILFSLAGENDGSRLFSMRAQELYRHLNMRNSVLKNSLNVAGAIAGTGDIKEASALLDSIYLDEESGQDSIFFNELLISRWKIMCDTVSLYDYVNRVRPTKRVSNKNNYMFARKSLMFSSFMMPDSALFYAKLALKGINYITNLEALTTIYSANSEAWDKVGNTDSALYYLKLKDELTPHRIAQENANNLRGLRAKTAIMEADAKAEAMKQANKSRLIITILSCVSLILVVVFILQRRISQAKIREEKARTEAEQKNRQLAVSACALQEKENVIESMRQIINRNKEEGKLSTSAAQELNTSINIYLDNNEEWDNLSMLHSAIHPGFTDEMIRLYPEISDSKLQLASYIVAGLTSKQIARLMKIQPDSVKKARWKLRTMMALPTEASLEQALSEIHKRLNPYS